MPCRSPLTVYRKPDGSPTFSREESTGRIGLHRLACGVCRDCRLARARDWAVRCYHESQLHERNCWLTLTFAEDPGSIAKRDLQLFFKRLRKAGRKFSYFGVGEYGEKFARPHYHVCIFGESFENDRYPWKKSSKGLLYRSPSLEVAWPHGHALISELTQENAGYTARYTMKKIGGDLEDLHYRRDFNGSEINVTPEFALMSKQPAIGLGWIQQHWRELSIDGSVVYKGKRHPIPAFYWKWLKANQPETFEVMDAERKKYHAESEPETGIRMAQAAHARDLRTTKLVRQYERITHDS